MSKEISDADLMDVADDPAQARRLHKALRTLADNPNADGTLKEMAREVLSGRLGMREALGTGAYLGALGDRMAELKRTDERLTPEERAAQEERARRWFEQRADEGAAEAAEAEDAREDEAAGGHRRAVRRDPRDVPPAYRPPSSRD
ncbi:hypothetical protein [Actinacidiphila sp. bgisy160]|uniref:hypothetical protein n=1 Tax=Actinacidiphila sp. bgisy160 TaxID=3413796 RepID=UPI003D720695